MSDGTPILRADALDDDLDHEPEWDTDIDARVIPASGIFADDGGWECYENGEGGWSYRRVFPS